MDAPRSSWKEKGLSFALLGGVWWTLFSGLLWLREWQWVRLKFLSENAGQASPASADFAFEVHRALAFKGGTLWLVVFCLALLALVLLERFGRWRFAIYALVLMLLVGLRITIANDRARGLAQLQKTLRQPEDGRWRHSVWNWRPNHDQPVATLSTPVYKLHTQLHMLYVRPKRLLWVEPSWEHPTTEKVAPHTLALRLQGRLDVYTSLEDYLARKKAKRHPFSCRVRVPETSTDGKKRIFSAPWYREWVFWEVVETWRRILRSPKPALAFQGRLAVLKHRLKTPAVALFRQHHRLLAQTSKGRIWSYTIGPEQGLSSVLSKERTPIQSPALAAFGSVLLGLYPQHPSRIWVQDGKLYSNEIAGKKLFPGLSPRALSLSPFGHLGAGVEGDRELVLFSPEQRRILTRFSATERVERTHFALDGRDVLWVTSTHKVFAMALDKRPYKPRLIGVFPGKIHSLKMTRTSTRRVWVAGAHHSILGYDLAQKRPPLALRGLRGTIQTLAVSRDGRAIAAADTHKGLLIWDTASHKPHKRYTLPAPARGLAFMSLRQARLAVVLDDGRFVKLW